MLLLDTCAVIFIAMGEKMRTEAMTKISDAVAAQETVAVSPFSAWEIGMQASKGRIVLSQRPESWFDTFLSRTGFSLAPLTVNVLILSNYLPTFVGKDPADRIIAATAREFGLTLITRDEVLLTYARTGNINAIKC